MKTLICLAFLLALTLSDRTVTQTCTDCGGNACITMTGAFDFTSTLPGQSCANLPLYPITFQFTCSSGCADCHLQQTASGVTTPSVCLTGTSAMTSLNAIGNSGFDWCNCSSGLSTGAIIGIAVGCVILVIIIVVVVVVCCRKRNSNEANPEKPIPSSGTIPTSHDLK